jgi:hypothetical protein
MQDFPREHWKVSKVVVNTHSVTMPPPEYDDHTNCWGTAPNIILSIYTLVITLSIIVHRYVVGRRGKARASRQTANELRAVYTQNLQSAQSAAQSAHQMTGLPLPHHNQQYS